MKLMTLECPKCNAQLEVNATLTQATCNYCGFRFLIDPEVKQVNINMGNPRQTGYEFAWGESEQKTDEARYCADKVMELIKPVSDLNRLTKERDTVYRQMEELKKNKINTGMGMPVGISVLVFVMILLMGGISIVTIGAGVLCAVVSFYICKYYQQYRSTVWVQQSEQAADRYNDLNYKISNLNQQYDFDFIPLDYRYERAMNFFYSALRNQRAVNLQEAVNLYEEEKHREEMAAFQREQLEIQRQQLEEQKRQTAMQNRKLQQIEENTREQEQDDSGLGKALLVGGAIITAIALSKKSKK